MLNPVVHAFDQLFKKYINYGAEESAQVQLHIDTFIQELHTLSYKKDYLPWLNRERHLVASSFGRDTHINPLKHVQLLVCLNSESAKMIFDKDSKAYIIRVNAGADRFGDMVNADRELMPNAIARSFMEEFRDFPDAKNVSISPEGGATYRRKGCLWVFNVIPAFFVTHPKTKETFYLVPDNKGHWKHVYPHSETDALLAINREHNGFMYDLIRIMKYWNREHDIPTIPSALLEAIVVNYCQAKPEKLKEFADLDIAGLLRTIKDTIKKPVMDPLGKRGDLNTIPVQARQKIADQAFRDQLKAESARTMEFNRDYVRSIEKWSEVVGYEFRKLVRI